MKSAFYKLLECGFEYLECEYTHIKHLKSIHIFKFVKIILKESLKTFFQGRHLFKKFFFFFTNIMG